MNEAKNPIEHISFIMDGNRTWARNKGLPQLEGHRRGYNNVESIIDACGNFSIPVISFWALSDDNIKKRSQEEVQYLFDLLTKGISKLIKVSCKRNNRLYFVGDRSLLRTDCLEAIEKAEIETGLCTGVRVIFAIGYGGQDEIVRAVKEIIRSGISADTLKKEDILEALDTGGFPPPDLIIRTGGHMRHSGYFLFQSPYAEYGFSDKNWPEFDHIELERIITGFHERIRKFGK